MPMGSDGRHDMFWPQPWDLVAQAEGCFENFGVRPREKWMSVEYGGREALRQASNIVFR